MAHKAKATMDRTQIADACANGLEAIGFNPETVHVGMDKPAGMQGSIADMANELDRMGFLQSMASPDEYQNNEFGESEGHTLTHDFVKHDDFTIGTAIQHNAELIRSATMKAANLFDIPAWEAQMVIAYLIFCYAKGWVAEQSLAQNAPEFSKGGRNQDTGGIDGWFDGSACQVKSFTFEGSHKHLLVYYAFDDEGQIHYGTGKREADVLKSACDAIGCTGTFYKSMNYIPSGF